MFVYEWSKGRDDGLFLTSSSLHIVSLSSSLLWFPSLFLLYGTIIASIMCVCYIQYCSVCAVFITYNTVCMYSVYECIYCV